jgi:hypothetical protein
LWPLQPLRAQNSFPVSAGLIFDKKHRFESALGRSAKTTI